MSKEKVPPKPRLYQWYHHKNPKRGIDRWNIWVVKKDTVLWGFTIYPDGKSDLNSTNLRYWDEKDFPWHESLDPGEYTEESDMPHLDDGSKLLILQTVLNESKEDSHWLYR